MGVNGEILDKQKQKRYIGNTVADDNDDRYLEKGFAMISFRCDVTDWYTKVALIVLSDRYKNIGHYFAKM